MNQQPSNDALKTALNEVLMTAGPEYPVATQAFALIKLKRLRELRTTWFDTEELDIRRKVDAYLDQHA